jgi:hypothetical protein
MTLYILLALSFCLNILFLWYIRQVLLNHRDLGDFTANIANALQNFEDHLNTVYDLERFYGDSTLSGLLEHVKDLGADIKQYRQFFLLEEEAEEDEKEEE